MPQARPDHGSGANARPLKSNVLPFPSLMPAPPDPPRPSILRGIIALTLLAIATGLILMVIWSLITV